MDTTGSDTVRTRVVVHGRVQGVWFRASTQQVARDLGVTGWVRNRSDGTVEAVFEGGSDAVERAVAWVHDGPDRASVDRVEVDSEPPEGLATFEVRG